ncbi:VCBS repeat-containing protein [Streptomyces sp. NPDC089919]|uniref:FG-GAP repeat domain-containing protein n=1 Tax=Streptomyces sp. NPDC089919 TaxID=3155188 RepID=UPI0034208D1C
MRTRNLTALGGVTALLAAAALTTGTAAADGGSRFDRVPAPVVKPTGRTWISPEMTLLTGNTAGTFVYALSGAPLTDAGGRTTALPAGLTAQVGATADCTPRPGGVFVCSARGLGYVPSPLVIAGTKAADRATAHFGVVFVPPGGSVDKGVKEARTAGLRAEDGRHAARTVTVLTPAHVARNTLKVTAPRVKAGATVTHTVTLHAVDPGRLTVSLTQSAKPVTERRVEPGELRFGIGTFQGDPGLTCVLAPGFGPGLACTAARPGDYRLTYTVPAEQDLQAWHLDTTAGYEVWTSGTGNPSATTAFQVDSPRKVRDRHQVYARTADGRLLELNGSGDVQYPLRVFSSLVGPGWNGYDALTKLAPVTGRGTGGQVVARDRAGVLWSYGHTGDRARLAARAKVGGGWGVYREIAGAGDLTGDGRADLVARDAAGVLWLYPGAGKPLFGARIKVGSGWKSYDKLIGAGDVNRDGRSDLLARDGSGALWLYAGTGKAAAPFAGRVQVADGFGGYRSVAAPGDLTDDGRADLVTQDRAGALWLHAGTGDAAAPFAAPVPADGGLWGSETAEAKKYSTLF